MIYIEVNDQYVNVEQITSVSAANDTAIYLTDGRRISVPDWSADYVLDLISDAIETSQA